MQQQLRDPRIGAFRNKPKMYVYRYVSVYVGVSVPKLI